MRQALLGYFANSLILKQRGERMVTGNFVPGRPGVYQAKHLVTARELSEKNGMDLPLRKAAENLFADVVANGDGNLDHSGGFLEIARPSRPA